MSRSLCLGLLLSSRKRSIVDIPDIDFGRVASGITDTVASPLLLKSEELPPLVFSTNVLPILRSPLCNGVEDRLVDDRIPFASSEQHKNAKAKLHTIFLTKLFISNMSRLLETQCNTFCAIVVSYRIRE